MDREEIIRMALEALESDPISHAGLVSKKQAITALRQALVDADDISEKRVDETAKREHEWVGLTDDEADELVARFARYELLRKVEAKLKENNCGH